ncbi:MAG TPA: hypothetical protein VLZ29_01820 [Sulfurimonas sp.]|uniref:hypothetical protein n=1 Tax=Sulfurimonas sp. TaxID=2022749 RepID=UPI002CD8B548|nr:hypothetical protein [Sulfurimonas sp.]HUH41832.1 hypothetical protein [Sulfurimonas sp.]
MMNDANEISHHTQLYGFIGEFAGQNSISATLNKLFKAKNKNAMMIPMNIREDDVFFTLSNMKKSHVNGALISSEYVKNTLEVLDERSDVVEFSGLCDIIIRDDKKLIGDVLSSRAIVKFLKDKGAEKIALLGVDARAKAFVFFAKEFDVSYYFDEIEQLMHFCQESGIEDADINRIAEGMDIDLSSYDAVIDFSDFESLSMISKLSAINLDMKHKKEFSALKVRANELEAYYVGFDNMLDVISQATFEFLEDKKHLEHDKSDMKF